MNTAQDLQSVVRTMKALSAVSIRQYQQAVKSLREYNRVIELAFRILLKNRPKQKSEAKTTGGKRLGVVLFGSDQGMCGQFNEVVISHLQDRIYKWDFTEEEVKLITVGKKVTDHMKSIGLSTVRSFTTPGSAEAITVKSRLILPYIQKWYSQPDIKTIYLLFNKYESGASYHPTEDRLLPLNDNWIEQLKQKKWPTKKIPKHTIPWENLFLQTARHYLFASLYTAFAQSLAAEHAARLQSMQGAEKNISERLEELTDKYHRQRHSAITSELLDIVSGFEAVTNTNR